MASIKKEMASERQSGSRLRRLALASRHQFLGHERVNVVAIPVSSISVVARRPGRARPGQTGAVSIRPSPPRPGMEVLAFAVGEEKGIVVRIGLYHLLDLSAHDSALRGVWQASDPDEMINILSFDRYLRMKERCSDYGQALSLTNLRIRCWLLRIGQGVDRFDGAGPPTHRVLAWLLGNHIIQSFYRQYGVDAIPLDCGGMYGYGLSVGRGPTCLGDDVGETAWIACGSMRVDPRANPELPSFAIRKRIERVEDPLWLVDTASIVAVGGRWPNRCRHTSCEHYRDSAVYLAVNQALTLFVCMGYACDAILGTNVEDGDDGTRPTDAPHPLRRTGLVAEPSFTQEFVNVLPVGEDGKRALWIHRRTGDLLSTWEDRIVPFGEWFTGDVDQGLYYLCRLVGGSK